MISTLLIGEPRAGHGALTDALMQAGFELNAAATGRDGVAQANRDKHQVVLLRIPLPDMSAPEALRALAASEVAPPVMVLADRDDADLRVQVLELGAADVLGEAPDTRELALRLRLAASRSTRPPNGAGVQIDADTRSVSVGGEQVQLSPGEFQLLVTLKASDGRLWSRAELRDAVWGQQVALRSVDAAVKRLRNKLGPARDVVQTVRAAGYRYNER